MATITEFQHEVVGNYIKDMASVKVTTLGTTSLAVPINQMHSVTDVISIVIYDSGGNVVTSDVDVTVSGNTVTVADGSSFSLTDTYVLYLTVAGIRKT